MLVIENKTRKAYAGIGSRETPEDVQQLMYAIGCRMADKGMVLRSGGAAGADTAFMLGCVSHNGPKEIYLPWSGFNGHRTNLIDIFSGASNMAMCIASRFHPNWDACSPAAKKLHARNSYQILGLQLNDPVEGVVCWTKNAAGGGGTGQALRIARHYNIKIYDLADPQVRTKIEQELRT